MKYCPTILSGLRSLGVLMGIISLMSLVSCSDDKEEEGGLRQRVTFEAKPCLTEFNEVAEARATDETGFQTRAWNPTYGTIYDPNGMFANQKNLVNKSIGVFFTNDIDAPIEGTFTFRNSDNTWHLTTEIETKTYQLYGYIPKEDATSASISHNGSYSNGAVLTIYGLKTVTPSDVCVIVGANNGPDEDHDGGLTMGNFDVDAKATDINSNSGIGNFIYLLFDHIYSALRFSFKLDAEYAALRTIRLRKLELIAYANDSGGAVRAKYNARITLLKNNSGASPIVGDVVFEADNSSASVAPVPLYDWENDPAKYVTLTAANPQQFMGCFVPGDHTYFKLITTYDVFDNNATPTHPDGNLIRQGCRAENTFDLRSKLSSYMETVRGQRYSYTITVNPTYLYVLSEPDLDNPTLTIN